MLRKIKTIMAKILIREILKEKQMPIKLLASKMGVTPSAVSQLLANPNPSIQQLEKIAVALEVDLMDLITQEYSHINGYVEIDGEVYSIKTKEQLINLTEKIDGTVRIPLLHNTTIYSSLHEYFYPCFEKGEFGSVMKRYYNRAFALTYNPVMETFTLTICINNGKTHFLNFPLNKNNGKDSHFQLDNGYHFVQTLQTIIDTIESMQEDGTVMLEQQPSK